MAKRRGHGEGSIFERTVDGKVVGYRGLVDLGYIDGKRRRKSVNGATRAEVKEKIRAALNAKDAGTDLSVKVPTVGEWLTLWLSMREKGQTIRPLTLRRYTSLTRRHLIPGLGHIRLDRLTDIDVQRFLGDKLGELHPRTVHHIRAVLRTSLNRARKSGLITRNAAADAEPVRVEDERRRFLTTEDARAIMAAAEGHRLRALYVLTASLGLRIGEALGLRWSDLDFDSGRLDVVYSVQRVRGKLTLVEPKTRKSRRTLRVPAPALEALRRHRAAQLEEKMRARPVWQDTDMIFTSTIGSMLDPSDVSRGFQELLRAHDLPKVRFHDLRHYCAAELLSRGVNPKTVQEILGHSTIRTTLDVYGHVMPAALDGAAEAMGLALGG